jgi:hypothetical protein
MAELKEAASEQRVSANTVRDEVSLVRGGPFYRAQEALRLVHPDRWNVGKRMIFALAIGWLPLVLITLLLNPRALLGLLTDYTVNARMLFGVPVLLAGQPVMETTFRAIVRAVRDAGLLTPSDTDSLDKTLVRLIRLRDSVIPELIFVVIAYSKVAETVQTQLSYVRPWGMAVSGAGPHLTTAGWYYVLVSQLLYQLLILISLWKWLLWCIFLYRLSKMDLQLVPTHPDQHGGVGFLGLSPVAITPTFLVISAVIGATWRAEIFREHVHWLSFKIEAIVLFGVVLIVTLGPLLLFVPRLTRLRRLGIFEYGALGQFESMQFHKRWIQHRAGREEEFPASPEASTLTDYGSSYQNIEHLQPFPFDQGAFFALILAVAIPLLPVVLAEVPFATVLKALLEAVR